LGGGPGGINLGTLPKARVGAAMTYFLLNNVIIATAVTLSTRESLAAVWRQNFLWSAPSYFVGAGAAALAAWFVDISGQWLAPPPRPSPPPLYSTPQLYLA